MTVRNWRRLLVVWDGGAIVNRAPTVPLVQHIGKFCSAGVVNRAAAINSTIRSSRLVIGVVTVGRGAD
jgi:hypothetical protein